MIDLTDAGSQTISQQTANDPYRQAGSGKRARAAANSLYVRTADIQQAVRGHEIQVFNAVGIEWTGSHSHIECPYPRHSGSSNWQWDPSKSVAFCSCIGQAGEKEAPSIFDVVMAAERIGFDSAKIRVAEIIGRRDLLNTRRGKFSQHGCS